MEGNNNFGNNFSLIADFDGDMNEILHTPVPETLPLLPLRDTMLFPSTISSIIVGRKSSRKIVEAAVKKNSLMAAFTQKDSSIESPKLTDLYPEGVAVRCIRTIELPDGKVTALLQACGAIKITGVGRRGTQIYAEVEHVEETIYDHRRDEEFAAEVDACREAILQYIQLNNGLHGMEAKMAINNISHPVFLINFICVNVPFTVEDKAQLLALHDVKQRAMKLLELLNRESEYAKLRRNIQMKTQTELDQEQHDYFLRQQIKNIQRELNDENGNSDVQALRESVEKRQLKFPPKVLVTFNREIEKLGHTDQRSPDYNVQLNYLQTIVNLPWGVTTKDELDIPKAKRILDRDHYGLERVKERILEYLAAMLFKPTDADKKGLRRAPILCLYGPPGVGKTSLGRSIAEALGKKYIRVSLGGVNDEAEIRGHRRTYVGAMPGRIIKGLQKVDSANPLFVLDEIDKVGGSSLNGDPQSALLEVLDPEQNKAFHDNFLDLDFDLSQVFFVATANNLQTIPAPLLDRMEVIPVEGYLTEEKLKIASRHLIPKEQKNYDFGEKRKVKISSKAVETIIEQYTRESGVRQLEKQIEKIFRKVAYKESTGAGDLYLNRAIQPDHIKTLLGKPPFNRDKYQGNHYAGVVTGLAWTAVGGEILFIETSVSKSKAPKLTLTGNLGDVMKESAMLALEYIKAHADELGIDYRIFEHWGVHIHVPEGATPKDGPSAGITIATSIASALTQRRVRAHLAMTGEITLRGRVLPVGGIKEKILAAKRAGITDIVISRENRKDIEEINERYVAGLTFHFVEDVQEVLHFALLNEKVENAIDLAAAITTDAEKKD